MNGFGAQYDSGIKTTSHIEHGTTYGILIRRLQNRATGERQTVFCAEHLVPFPTSVWESGTYFTPTNPVMKQACKVAYFGWYSKYGDYAVDGGILDSWATQVRLDYVFTQKMIWEVLGQDSGTFVDSTIASQYESFKADINSKINNMSKRTNFDGQQIEVDAGSSTVLIDTNGVLKDYQSIDITDKNIRFQHTLGENTLTITVFDNCDIENYYLTDLVATSWGLIKEESIDHDTTIYFDFPTNLQDQLYCLNYNDPIPLSLALKINLYGELELTKTNTNNDLVDASIFNLKGPNNYNQDIEVVGGKLKVEKLRKGTYQLKEKFAPNRIFIRYYNTYSRNFIKSSNNIYSKK